MSEKAEKRNRRVSSCARKSPLFITKKAKLAEAASLYQEYSQTTRTNADALHLRVSLKP